jgi:hypothetical protein
MSSEMILYAIGKRQNAELEWLAFLLRIREVPGLNLGPETGYLD